MPDLFRHPVLFWIVQKLHCVSRLSGNDGVNVFICRSNMMHSICSVKHNYARKMQFGLRFFHLYIEKAA